MIEARDLYNYFIGASLTSQLELVHICRKISTPFINLYLMYGDVIFTHELSGNIEIVAAPIIDYIFYAPI